MMMRAVPAALLLISVGNSPLQAACPGGVSNSFSVSGEVTKRTVFDLNNLEQFPPAQQNVTYFAAGSVVTESFTGVLLWALLNNSPVGGIVTDPAIKNDILHKVVIVTGTDCYQSVFGAGEIDPFFWRQSDHGRLCHRRTVAWQRWFCTDRSSRRQSRRPICLEYRQDRSTRRQHGSLGSKCGLAGSVPLLDRKPGVFPRDTRHRYLARRKPDAQTLPR
jgi:hypothetical protein